MVKGNLTNEFTNSGRRTAKRMQSFTLHSVELQSRDEPDNASLQQLSKYEAV